MPKIHLAFYDPEEAYVEAFVGYLLANHGKDFEVAAFTTEAAFREYVRNRDGAGEGAGGRYLCCVFEEEPAKAEDASATSEEGEGMICLGKYRPADELVRHLQGAAGFPQGRESAAIREGEPENVWVYSPTASRFATPFAYTYAALRARREKVLYINFSENGAFGKMFGRTYESDLADVIFLMKQSKKSMGEILEQVAVMQDRMDVIPPMRHPLDRADVSGQEWEAFLEKLATEVRYDCVVFDMDAVLTGMMSYMKQASEIFLIGEDRPFDGARLEDFCEAFTARCHDSVRPEKVTIAPMRVPYSGENLGEQWIYGEWGDVVREYMHVAG